MQWSTKSLKNLGIKVCISSAHNGQGLFIAKTPIDTEKSLQTYSRKMMGAAKSMESLMNWENVPDKINIPEHFEYVVSKLFGLIKYEAP